MMIHFIRPLWLLILIPMSVYLVWIIYSHKQNNPWKKICDSHLLPSLLQSKPHSSKIFFNINLFLFFMLAIFALAGPSWKQTKLPIYRDINSLVLILDLSSSMLEGDLKPNRLARAKFKIRDLIKAAQNTQMGLIVFTSEAFVASPLSQDANTLDILIDELHTQMMPVSGSDMAQGLTQGLTLLQQTNVNPSNLLLITASEPTGASWSIAKRLSEAGHRLSVLAIMEANNATQVTLTHLQQLAKMGGGRFYLFKPDLSDVQIILASLSTKEVIKDINRDQAYLWQDAGPWFCLLLIPFALAILRKAR